MKNLLYIILIALFLGGCSYKNDAIMLKAYDGDYAGEIAKEKKSIHLGLVQDMRADKRVIGYVQKEGTKLYSDVDFAAQYQEGLKQALRVAGFNSDVTSDNASFNVEVHIKNIHVVYSDKLFGENLKGEIDIEVIVKKESKVTTLNFKESSAKWMAPSYDSKDIEPFLQSIFSNSIDDIVSRLTKY
ncbi:YajG family lipoprotein [bacterium]|nr:YajG family lipoprotein [bacterium]MBU1883121.1 YajG family lipoprotein [bacterium]